MKKNLRLLKQFIGSPSHVYLDMMYHPLLWRTKRYYSRIDAKNQIRSLREKQGRQVVTPALLRRIKEYARAYFGSSGYWPWLAFYTEMRGEFHEGWIPSDFFWLRLLSHLNPPQSSYISYRKSFDHRMFGAFSIQPVLFRTHGVFFDADFQSLDAGEAFERVRQIPGEVVLKKEKGKGGKDILFVRPEEVTKEMLLGRDEYLVQQAVKQHDYMNSIYPGSINTIRITTFLEDDGSVSVKFAVVRVGLDGSRTDNLSSGGCMIMLDENGHAVTGARSRTGEVLQDRHPATGFPFREMHIPWLPEAADRCRQAHLSYPYLRLVGWDVIIDPHGRPRLLEWNGRYPGFLLFEAEVGPLWKPDQVRAMVDRYGLV